MKKKILALCLAFFISGPLCRADGSYSIHVFYRGYLTDGEKKIVKHLETESKKGSFSFRSVSPSSSEFDWKDYAVWKEQDQNALPRIVLRFPESLKIKKNVWSGSLDIETANTMLSSEKRDEIASFLKKGAAAVWIFVRSGEDKLDDPAFAMLKETLAGQKVSFPIVKLLASDRNERVLLSILGKIKGNHDGLNPPALFQIIGKGNVAACLSGDKLTHDNILKLCETPTSSSSDEKIFFCVKWNGGAAASGAATGKGEKNPPSQNKENIPVTESEKTLELAVPGDKLSFGSVSFQRYYSFAIFLAFAGIMALIIYAVARSDKKRKS